MDGHVPSVTPPFLAVDDAPQQLGRWADST
jgi:hypothetical protein